MKRTAKTVALCLIGTVLTLPVRGSAMEHRRLTLPLFEEMAVELSAEELEYRWGFNRGELTALRVLTVPEKGRLVSGGVEVERGEILLRWELEQLYYLSDVTEDDWFAVIPIGNQPMCALVELKAIK